jgi:hypothetical protein
MTTGLTRIATALLHGQVLQYKYQQFFKQQFKLGFFFLIVRLFFFRKCEQAGKKLIKLNADYHDDHDW